MLIIQSQDGKYKELQNKEDTKRGPIYFTWHLIYFKGNWNDGKPYYIWIGDVLPVC